MSSLRLTAAKAIDNPMPVPLGASMALLSRVNGSMRMALAGVTTHEIQNARDQPAESLAFESNHVQLRPSTSSSTIK